MLADVVDQTIAATIEFVDHKRVTGEMRVTLTDPQTGAEAVLTAEEDLNDLYWFEP